MLIIVVHNHYLCLSQGVFSGRVGTGNQLGLSGPGTVCLLGECLHGNGTEAGHYGDDACVVTGQLSL